MHSHFSLIWESVADAVPEHLALIQANSAYRGATMRIALPASRKA